MPPNSTFHEYLGEKVKGFYTNKKYSDVDVRIIEAVPTTGSDVHSSSSKDMRSKTIRCHKLLLHINSPYFEDMLEKEGEGVDELDVRVEPGQAKYMEMLLSYFYDEGMIKNLCMTDLICLFEVCVTYARSHHQEAIVEFIVIKQAQLDFDSATLGLNKLMTLEKFSKRANSNYMNLLNQTFATFFAKNFAPIEENQDKHESFLCHQYDSLVYMLQGNEPIAASENSLMVFVNEWLDFDITRQTPDNIEGLLRNIRTNYMSGVVLHFGIGMKNRILNKWDGYRDWLCNALGLLSLSPEERGRVKPSNEMPCRNIPGGTHAWFMNRVKQNLGAIRWKVHMTTVDKGKKLEPTPHLLVHDGVKFSPQSITISPIEGDDTKFKLSLLITSSYSMFGVRFVVGIVPANQEYDITNKYFHGPFAQAFLKWTERIDVETKSKNVDFWTISGDLVKISDKYGLYVFLLPLTGAEYEVLKCLGFSKKCFRCEEYLSVFDRQGCVKSHGFGYKSDIYPAFAHGNISLDASSNFSV